MIANASVRVLGAGMSMALVGLVEDEVLEVWVWELLVVEALAMQRLGAIEWFLVT